ncbi:T9SS type A sorting domain-containing protein [bacterium]|nr:T9SS type A sorting domain-containing protein [bacterium]MBU1983419.1 T9SS type A sorting domain-containing protein [bacterium]
MIGWCCWAGIACAIAPEVHRTAIYPETGTLNAVLIADTIQTPRWAYLGGTAVIGSYRFHAMKVDSTGSANWSRTYGSTLHFSAMTTLADSSLAMIGYTTENATWDYKLMRLSPSGTLRGSYTFGGNTSDDVGRALMQRPDGWLYVAGSTEPDAVSARAMSLLKVSSSGQIDWARIYPQGSVAEVVMLVNDTTVHLYGTRDSDSVGTSSDMVMIRTDTLGLDPVVRRFRGPQWEVCTDAVRISAELTLLIGNTRPVSGGAWDILVMAINDAGDSLWSRTYGTAAPDYANSAAATTDRDSGFVIAGWSDGAPQAERRGFLMKISRASDSLWTLYTPQDAESELTDVVQDSAWRYHAAGSIANGQSHGYYLITEPDPHSPGPHRPFHFSLLTPRDAAIVDSAAVVFEWEAAEDPDEGDTVAYTLELSFDTTFGFTRPFGPIDTTRFIWPVDTDDVRFYWRVTAVDLLGNTRLCRERRWSFRCAIPDSMAEFSLISPDSGTALTRPVGEFRWQRARDPDANDSVVYALHFVVGDTGLTFPSLRDTFINVSFVGNPLIGEADTVLWYVTARSFYPPMERESRERWMFVSWSAGVEDEYAAIPVEFALAPPAPNPFNSVTRLRYGVDRLENVRLDVFDVQGRLVTTLASGMHTPGWYEREWDAAGIASGSYFIRLAGADRVRTVKVILLK